jgi:homoserine kinase type II
MAVYTEVSDAALARLTQLYDIGPVTALKGIAEGVENSNYLLTTANRPYILTLYEKRVNPEDLPFFLGLMDHLAARGLTCPTPVRTRDGKLLVELEGRPAALVTFLDGVWLKSPEPRHCRAVGAAMATMHKAAAGFDIPRANALSLNGWRFYAGKLTGQADGIKPGMAALITSELSHLERHWPRTLPAGVIHADLFPNNVFFLGDRLSGLIDFYFACNDLLAYDIAIGLVAWCFTNDGQWDPASAAAFVEGYHAVRPLQPDERAALPLLMRGAALRFMLTRAYDWLHTADSALVKRLDPGEYFAKLTFLGGISQPEHLGLGA